MNQKNKEMKSLFRTLLVVISILIFSSIINSLYSQGAPPPPPSEHGQFGNQESGGSAPIGSGLGILLIAVGLYGVHKYIYNKKEDLEE